MTCCVDNGKVFAVVLVGKSGFVVGFFFAPIELHMQRT
jgi:hypothetical protein